MKSELMEAMEALAKEKDISKDILLNAIELSLLTACKNHFGKADNVKVEMNRDTGEYRLYQELKVVEEVTDPVMEISLEDARKKYGATRELGDIVQRDIHSKDFGRIAAQNAKSVILQKIREEERKSVLDRYSAKEREVVTGTVQRFLSNGGISVNLGKSDATLSEPEQVKTERYNIGDRIKVFLLEVKDAARGPRILVSRTHPDLVKRLFEMEVSEIQDGTVEIKAIAREAGSRTKMAVWSNDPNVDPIGACVGVGGKRVNAVVDELHGEKIDIINWSDSSAELIENALSPAQVICVLADDDEKTAIVVVPDNMLSLAIGKVGQNARLAAKLTGYKIDIKNETQARESGLFEEIGYIDDYFDSETDDGSGEFEIGGDYAEEYDEFTGEVIGYADETPDEGTAGHEAANDGEDMGHEDTDHEGTDQENTEQEDTGLEEDGHDHMEAEALDNPGEDREE